MSIDNSRRERRRIQRLAKEYRTKGYEVVIHPTAEDLPQKLIGLRPDLMAVSEDDRVLIEVKTHESVEASSDVTRLAEAAQELGWRFEFVLTNPRKKHGFRGQSLTYSEILMRSSEAVELEGKGYKEAALLLAWSALEGAVRAATQMGEARQTESSLKLIKTLYSLGGLAADHYEWLQQLYQVRRRMTHGLDASVQGEPARRLAKITEEVLVQHNFR